ncbi:hypothetical protein [Streptomyces sp. NPDC006459]|uniref:hypothetical protein n=1 Tax=Streptomyces sp. NPDC006459 TaxID=3154303 RepID=UPI0033BF2AD3
MGKMNIPGRTQGLHAKKKHVLAIVASALTVAAAAGGLQLMSTASAAEDCVSGAAAMYSTKPICKNTPPSDAEQTAGRVVDGVLSLGLTEAIENAMVSTHQPEGCIEPAAIEYSSSSRPICKTRPLTDTEKALAKAGLSLTGAGPSATASLPRALQRFADAAGTISDAAGAAKVLTEG